MVTVPRAIPVTPERQLRPFDPQRDFGAVADLVELCFHDTLDAEGREYVERMRAAARGALWEGWLGRALFPTPTISGFVWQEGERLVGNVSLLPFYVQQQRYYLIANVAVHPDYRRRGIARRLTERAILYAYERKAPAVWLHVREGNQPAIRLYQDLGFLERGRRTTWLDRLPSESGHLSSEERVTPLSAECWPLFRKWLLETYPPHFVWHLPLHLDWLRPGWLGGFQRMLLNLEVREWAFWVGGQLRCAVAWQAGEKRYNYLWLAADPECTPRQVHALLTQVRNAAKGPLLLEFPAHRYEPALLRAGFIPQQTLIWMELPFSERRPATL